MAFFLDVQETISRFGDYIEEFRAILAANDIKFGSPDNFFAFARRLQSDDLLPGDLSRMVKSIFERESDQVSLRTILTIIAIASGGSAVGEADRDLSKPVNLVLDFLIGSVNCIPIDLQQIDNTCMPPFATTTDLDEKDVSDEAPSPFPTELPASDVPNSQIDNSSTDDLPLQPLDRSSELIQSLTRLELNTLQAKLYLDSIEQRINRMEPRLENAPSLVSPPSNQSPAPNTEPLHLADPLPEPPSIPSDLPLPSFVRRASTQSKERLAWFFLLGEKFAVVPVLATIAGGTLLYIAYPRNSVKTEIPSDIPRPTATIATPSTIADSASFVPPTDSQTDATTEDAVKPPKPSAGHPAAALDETTIKNHPDRTPRPLEPPANHATSRSIPSANVEAAETPTQRPTETVANARREAGHTLTRVSMRSGPSSPRMVDVSSGVMAANLVSASPPSYPKLASLTHMQGEVVMQAIISKDGSVQNLHVIQGHHLLRGAAKNAVRTWQYHPFLVNGKPVEVATIVSVDFTLGH